MANLTDQQVLSAHTARIFLDSEEVGFVQNISVNIDTGIQGVFAIGSVEDQEHQQTHYSVRGSFSRFYVRDTMIQNSKLGARSAAEMIRTGTFDLEILDDNTGEAVTRVEACTLSSKAINISAGSLISHQFSFVALRTR